MSKRSVRDLEERVVQLGLLPSDERRAEFQAEAESSWLIYHLTEDERDALVHLLVSIKDGQASPPDWERRHGDLMAKAAERAAKEPPSLREEFIQKSVRAEMLRQTGRRLTEAEGDELRALNAWLLTLISVFSMLRLQASSRGSISRLALVSQRSRSPRSLRGSVSASQRTRQGPA